MGDTIDTMSQAKILVVEDDAFLREVFLETLQREGYEVESAANGNEGLEKLQQAGWDLVLLDIIMPEMDGLEVMKRINASGKEKPCKKVIFLTNLDNDNVLKEALTLGDGYLIKSQLTPPDLVKEVKLFLS